jgi:AcrR family transcriptional regulator
MGDAGLTHGGFYRYFTSKEALIKEAVETGMDDKLKQTIKAARTPQKGVSQQFLTAGIGLPCELFFESAYLLANVGGAAHVQASRNPAERPLAFVCDH